MTSSSERPDPRSLVTHHDFTVALRALRAQSGLTVREVAAQVALRTTEWVPVSTVGGWFSGTHLPSAGLVRTGTVALTLAVCGVSDAREGELWLRALERIRRRPRSARPARPLQDPTDRSDGRVFLTI